MSLIDEYLKRVDKPQKVELERVRKIVKHIAPNAEETISYGIPAFKYKGKYLIGFAAFKNHMSIFPASEPIELLKDKLHSYKTSKGTIQYSLSAPIGKSLIEELVTIRLKSIT